MIQAEYRDLLLLPSDFKTLINKINKEVFLIIVTFAHFFLYKYEMFLFAWDLDKLYPIFCSKEFKVLDEDKSLGSFVSDGVTLLLHYENAGRYYGELYIDEKMISRAIYKKS